MTTREDVVLAYRYVLGREPENDDVITNLCQTTRTPDEVRGVLLRSAEFIKFAGDWVKNPVAVRFRHPQNLPKIPVDVQVSQSVLERMFARIQGQWTQLGLSDPFWSVLTQPQYRMQEFSQNQEEFLASGKSIHETFLATIRRCGLSTQNLRVCLEMGCGVGRMTHYLAGSFEKVIAADVSIHHLDLARTHFESHQINNVDLLHISDLAKFNNLPRVDVIQSVITIQHNPPPVMAWMISKLLACLNPGGVAFLQLPTYRNGYFFEAERYLNTTTVDSLEMHFLPQQEVFRLIAEHKCLCLEVREDSMVGEENIMLSNTFLIQRL